MIFNSVRVSKEGFGEGYISQITVTSEQGISIEVHWDNPTLSGTIHGWYSEGELEFLEAVGDETSYLRQALGVIQDVENRGLEDVGEEWPELLVTYNHAVEILS